MSRNIMLWAFLTVVGWALDGPRLLAQTPYDLPADRTTSWYPAGLDTVVGGIPTYTQVTCNGLDPTGVTDNTSAINACISSAAAQTAVYIPAGTYRVTGNLNMKSNVVLRGATVSAPPWLPTGNASMTTLNMTNGATVYFNGGSKEANWSPAAPNGTAVTAGYTQGSTSITVSDASSYAVNDYIAIYQNKEDAIVDDKGLTYLGEDCGRSTMFHPPLLGRVFANKHLVW
jgi:hypothetical protein